MAIGAPPDPIPALHGLFGLLEFEEIDAFDRNVLGWQRDQMLAVRNAPSGAAWLKWYRDLLQAVMQISARWQAAKESAAPVIRAQIAPQQLAAVARLREQPGIFSQRWGVRLQDQAATAKHRVLSRLDSISTRASETQTHVTFFVPDDQLAAFRRDVLAELNAWAAHAETAIAASWMEAVRDAVRGEGLASGATPPPTWSVRLSVSELPPLRLDTTSARRPAFFSTLMRETRVFALPLVPLLGGALTLLAGKSAVPVGVLSVAVTAGIMPMAGLWLRGKMAEERAQLEHDHRVRLLNQIESWAAATVDGFRVRMAGLLAPSSAEMRGRFAEWLDAGWGRATDSSAAATPSTGRGPDMGPWVLTLSSARSAIATRIAQLELELSTPSNAASAKP